VNNLLAARLPSFAQFGPPTKTGGQTAQKPSKNPTQSCAGFLFHGGGILLFIFIQNETNMSFFVLNEKNHPVFS